MGTLIIYFLLFSCMVFIIPFTVLHSIFKMDKKHTLTTSIIVALLFIAVALIFGSFLFPDWYANTQGVSNDFTAQGQLGDHFGGLMNPIIAIAGVIVTGLAFWIQYQANNDIRNQFKIQQFESQLYKVLDVHNQNVENWHVLSRKDNNKYGGKECAFILVNHFEEVISDLNFIIEKFNISPKALVYDAYFSILNIKLVNSKSKYSENNENLNELVVDKIDILIIYEIAHFIFFFGVNNEGIANILSHTIKLYDATKLTAILNYFSTISFIISRRERNKLREYEKIEGSVLRAKIIVTNHKGLVEFNDDLCISYTFDHFLERYNTIQNIETTLEINKYLKYYNGVQNMLGHYYRNIYMAYKFINKFNIIQNEKELYTAQKNYAKLFRTQLSNYQQILFYLNSLNNIGGAWELNNPTKVSKRLITKYHIIKNIPKGDRDKYHIELFYPDVDYEDKE